MAQVNTAARTDVRTHEGGKAQGVSPLEELRRAVLTCLLWENTAYESGSELATRIADLVRVADPAKVAALAVEARDQMQLRHAPLFLLRELARRPGVGPLIAATLPKVIQRADELAEFVAIYWKDEKRPLSAGVKRGLAAAFGRFNEYQLAKYNRDKGVRLRDVLRLVHPVPANEEQSALWKRLAKDELATPETWETGLSAGKDKRETFERLLSEKKLGGLAVLRNLRKMLEVGVSESLIRERLGQGIKRALPFRFLAAARHAQRLEDAIDAAMLLAVEGLAKLPGSTGLLVDVSGSMDAQLSARSENTRVDAACGLAILLREQCETFRCATFSTQVVEVPPRRGMALRDAIGQSQPHGSTYLRAALEALRPHWAGLDRVIVITDEQSHDGSAAAWTPSAWMVNVGTFAPGLGYGNGWMHVNGWSERIVDYIAAVESSAR